MQSGAPTFGTPEPAIVLFTAAKLARRLGVPFGSGGSLNGAKIPDAQAAIESLNTLWPSVLGGVNFVLHAAGWLEGGLVSDIRKFIIDADQCSAMSVLTDGPDVTENGQAMDAIRQVGPGQHFLGCDHTQRNFETAFGHQKFQIIQLLSNGHLRVRLIKCRELEKLRRNYLKVMNHQKLIRL